MAAGVIAALAVGQWATAVVVVFFMRVGDYIESFTAERARRAVKDLTALAPRMARVLRDGTEVEVPVEQVQPGEVAVVRPGEQIPVDGQVVDGQATVDQAAITGESMPVEAGPGAQVYAATIAHLGSLRVRTTRVGPDTTFGRVVKMVEEAEAHRADVQRVADRFSTWYLPVVGGIAGLTFLLRRDPLATAAVLVVACSCSFALATPIAVLASIGAAAKRGLLIKGGRYLETLARADVLLIDKTGTLTLGRPQITDVVAVENQIISNTQYPVLQLAASAERYSEHPLAAAVRAAAAERGLTLTEPADFEAVPGLGVRATVGGKAVWVGSRRLGPLDDEPPEATVLEAQGKTLLFVWAGRYAQEDRPRGTARGEPLGGPTPAARPGKRAREASTPEEDMRLIGLLAAADTLRDEVPSALAAVLASGIRRVELLTGDNERAAASLAGQIGVDCRANLLPEDKIRIVKEYQAQGHVVVMVGDGVNDAPALAQADVGIAMGAAGAHIAIEAAHVALMREDWSLVPQVLEIGRRTMRVVKMNLGFTVLYNAVGLSLAALGILPPMLAAAAQSLPDLGILGNSSRLLRQK
jgi:Cd2+/Zn2+-exporting ATPase/Cu+-exporting ATPase